ncbi:hypothetical protein ACTJKC_05215 [Pedobacter sp. 22226]|uniref:hypothetical protein n=1 Tax=Pedobacter sp. 22226 TaxID=3453894 RepID=UPI003F829D6E
MNKFIGIAVTIICTGLLWSLSCSASIPISSVPPPPNGCLVGGRMYTRYIKTVYEYDPNDASRVNEYRYIFSDDTSAPESCVNGGSDFYGPSPGGSGTVAIGCDINKLDYASTVHNPSKSGFTIVCPLDTNIYLLLLSSSVLVFFHFKRNNMKNVSLG